LKGPHTYWNPLVLYCHRHIDSNLIINVMLTIVKIKLSMSVATIQGIIKRDYWHEVFYWKTWMVKQKNIGDVIWYTRRVISKPT
jgi:hypothetical protein